MGNFWKEKLCTENSRVTNDEESILGLLEIQRQPKSHGGKLAVYFVMLEPYQENSLWQAAIMFFISQQTLILSSLCVMQAVPGPC